MRWDVLGLGCVAVDDLLYLPTFPTPDSKLRLRRRERSCGGLTANALVAAARLGASCAFAGTLGEDDDSLYVKECLRREGIDLSAVVQRPDVRPIHSTILVDESAQTRTILFDLTGSVGASPDWPSDDVLRSARVLFVDHYGVEGMIRAARVAREAGIGVVADLERDGWPGFPELLALVDHLIVPAAFARHMTGAGPGVAVQRLWTETRRAVVVTGGAEGCWYRGPEGSVMHQPAFAVEAADTTGCGDVFHGAYAAALAQGRPLEQRVRFSTAAAAIKATRAGGQAGYPSFVEVERFLENR